MASEDSTVLVTGASGYIATHVVQQLQEAGYRVRGTVRSTKNQEKVQPLRELCPGAKYPLELVEADLTKDEGWKEAVQGCTYVLHTASPFPAENPKDEMEIIGPAVEGTLSVLRACREVGGVRRVVLTSSVAAICAGNESGTFTEDDWTDVQTHQLAYYKSKTLAEKAAWDFMAELPDEEKFELSVMHPSYTVGPMLSDVLATAMGLPKRLLERKISMLPKIAFGFVDVRDVAAAHIVGMTEPSAAGKRHILATENLWIKDMADIYNEEFKGLGYNVPQKVAPLFLVKFMATFDKTIKMVIPAWGKVTHLDNTRMTSVLRIQPRPIRQSLVDMAHSMIDKGFIKRSKKYDARKGSN